MHPDLAHVDQNAIDHTVRAVDVFDWATITRPYRQDSLCYAEPGVPAFPCSVLPHHLYRGADLSLPIGTIPTGRILTMRITSKGQVTIPIAMREKLGLLPDVEVEFVLDRDSVRIKKARGKKTRGQLIVERLRGSAPPGGMTTNQIMALTRGE